MGRTNRDEFVDHMNLFGLAEQTHRAISPGLKVWQNTIISHLES